MLRFATSSVLVAAAPPVTLSAPSTREVTAEWVTIRGPWDPPPPAAEVQIRPVSLAMGQWLMGDWPALARLQEAEIETHPERARVALLVACAHQQCHEHPPSHRPSLIDCTPGPRHARGEQGTRSTPRGESDVTLRVERDLKADAGPKVVVTLEGGTVGDRTIVSIDAAEPKLGLRYLFATSPMGADTKLVKKGEDIVVGWQAVPRDQPLPELEVLKAALLASCEGEVPPQQP